MVQTQVNQNPSILSNPLGPRSLAYFDASSYNNQQPTNQKIKVVKHGEYKKVRDITSKLI